MPLQNRYLHASFINIGEDGENKVIVERPLYSQDRFDRDHPVEPAAKDDKFDICDSMQCMRNCKCCSRGCWWRFVNAVFPFISIMRNYNLKVDLLSDFIAGLTVGIMHIPQGMAYALLATLPPVYGLYVSFFPVLIYFFMGSSRHISVGTFAVTSLMVGAVADKGYATHHPLSLSPSPTNATITTTTTTTTTPPTISSIFTTDSLSNTTLPYPNGGDDNVLDPIRLQYAISVTFLAGAIQLLMGLCRLGFIVIYLSEPLISGFTTAAAFHVLISQISHVFGLTLKRNNGILKLPKTIYSVCAHITETNLVTMAISIVSMAALFLVKECINKRYKKRMKLPVPVELIVVMIMTIVSYFMSLNQEYAVLTVGAIPRGIPAPKVPNLTFFSEIITDAIALAIVGYAVSVSMAKILSRNKYDIDANQELVAIGSSNVFGSFFNSFFSSASLSRSLVQDNVGGKTQVTGLVSCGLLLAVLLEIGPHFSYLPKCILAAIVIVNLKGMFLQFGVLPEMWRISKYDFAIWMVTWFSSVLLDIDIGLGIGVLFSFITVLVRTQRAYVCLMGRIPHTDIYRDLKVCPAALQIPGVKIIRFEASLYFANIEYFKQKISELCEVDPQQVMKRNRKHELKMKKYRDVEQKTNGVHSLPDPSLVSANENETSCLHHIILDCSMMCFLDSVGVKTLAQVIEDYNQIGIPVLLASCKSSIREVMNKSDFYDKLNSEILLLTVHDAVIRAVTMDTELLQQINDCNDNIRLLSDIQYSNVELELRTDETDPIGNEPNTAGHETNTRGSESNTARNGANASRNGSNVGGNVVSNADRGLNSDYIDTKGDNSDNMVANSDIRGGNSSNVGTRGDNQNGDQGELSERIDMTDFNVDNWRDRIDINGDT